MEDGSQQTVEQGWLTPGRFTLFLAFLVIATYPHVIFGNQTFVYRDFGVFGYPLAFHQRESFWRGEIPLWNPLNHCGIPFLAQWNTLTLYPFALFYLIFPLSWSLPVFNLAHLVLGGAGMYILIQRWVQDDFAAAIGGLAYAFNGLSLNSLTWPNNIAALGWMPWVVFSAELGWTRGGRFLVIASVTGALQMLTGAPEVIALTWVFVGLLWLDGARKEPGAFKTHLPRLVGMVALISGLAAAQLLPFLDLLHHSQRRATYSYADWGMPGWGLANFFVPLFYTSIVANGVRFQYEQYWTSSYYLPIGVLAFALLSALFWRRRRVLICVCAAVISLILAMGNNGFVYHWVRTAFPALGMMRYPIKSVILPIFLIPILAAVTLSSFRRMDLILWRKACRLTAACWLLFVMIAGALCWVAWAYPQYKPPFSDWVLTCKNGAVRVVFLTLTLAGFLYLPRVIHPKRIILVQVGLLVLLWLDVLTHAPDQNPTVVRHIYQPDLGYLKPTPKHGISRAMLSPEAYLDLWRNTSVDTYTNYLCNRLGLNANINLLEHIPKIDGFYSLLVQETDVITKYFYKPRGGQTPSRDQAPNLRAFMGVSHMTAPGGNFEWLLQTNYLPMITGGQAPKFVESEAAFGLVTSTNFAPTETVILPPEISSRVTAKRVTDVSIGPSTIGAQRIEFDVKSSAPSLIVVAQTFYHPWRATVGGVPAELWKANYAFQALQVPAGTSHVRLDYVDRRYQLGLLVSFLSILLTIFMWYRSGPRGGQNEMFVA